MKFAVIPVSVADHARATALASAWLERACTSVGAYIRDHSGGKQSAEFKVFDWLPLTQTFQQWVDLGINVKDAINQQLIAARRADLSGFQHFIYVIDDGVSSAGVTQRDLQTTIIAARDIDPALIAHEITHVFGADDTHLDTPQGPQVYGGRFCVMGGEGSKFSFRDASLEAPAQGADFTRTDCGPGMCLPTLLATGWITLGQHGIQVSGKAGTLSGSVATIRALDGVTHTEGGLPVCCYLDDGDRYLVEYRLTRSKWDRGLPPTPGGWIVVHRTPLDSPLESLEVAAFPATPGITSTFGGPDSLYLFGASPLRLTVLNCDANAGTVELLFARRKAEVPQYIDPYRSFRQELRYVLWSPESGLHIFPASTDLAKVLKGVADLNQLRDTLRTMPRRHSAGLTSAFQHQRTVLQKSTEAIKLHDEPPAGKLLSRLGQLKTKLAAHHDFAELEPELAQLESLARALNHEASTSRD